MKIPKKLLGSAAKMFKSGNSAWTKKKQGIPFAALEELRANATSPNMYSRARKKKLFADKYGNTTSLRINSDRVAPWRIGEKYAPGERSKYDPTK